MYGVDKRPVALGGGFINIKRFKKFQWLNIFKNTIHSYPKESRFDDFCFF